MLLYDEMSHSLSHQSNVNKCHKSAYQMHEAEFVGFLCYNHVKLFNFKKYIFYYLGQMCMSCVILLKSHVWGASNVSQSPQMNYTSVQ